MSFLDELSARFGVPYRFAKLPEKCRAYLVDGAAVLNENLNSERAHWAYCHEVAHLQLGHPANPPRDDAEERDQETEANRLASDLLLPEDQFAPAAQGSLTELKRTFPFASHEVLARKRMRYRPGLLTIFDNGKMTARLVPDDWNPPAGGLFPLEREALKLSLESKGEETVKREGLQVEATYVDEGRGVIRVILFLEGEMEQGFCIT